VIGKPPVTMDRLEESIRQIRELAAGREVEVDGSPVQLKWAAGGELPIWVAAYGPKALRLAGRVGDGVVLQLADPYLIEWFLRYVREGAEEAGRAFEDIKVMAAAPAYVTDDLAHARDQVRWFPALVSNHVVDLVKRYEPQDLPKAFVDFIAAREHYDYAEHGRTGAEHAAFVPDDVVDRFCVLGTAEDCAAKLGELRDVGVHQFNIYSMVDDPEGVIRTFGRDVIPRFGTEA
jgi:probable F420-dependent oxidoreductase